MVKVMKVKRDQVEKVLALFDDEDIFYIHSKKLDTEIKNNILKKPIVKVRGGKDDGQRK